MKGIVEQKKRRQHHVWRYYLDAWTTDGNLWCSREAKVFEVSPQNIAHRRDFYRLREMSELDLKVVQKLLIEPLPQPLRSVAEGWIPMFTELFVLQRQLETSSNDNATLEKAVDVVINNLEENMHADLEQQALPLLAALRARQSDIFENDNAIAETWFLAAQHFRTPQMLSRIVDALKEFDFFNAEAAFGLMRTIFSNNVGYSFWKNRSQLRLTYLEVSEFGSLITGDQPILNTRAQMNTAPEHLELYYPLTPSLGALFDFDAGAKSTAHRRLSAEEIADYNWKIYEASGGVVYGANKNIVAQLKDRMAST